MRFNPWTHKGDGGKKTMPGDCLDIWTVSSCSVERGQPLQQIQTVGDGISQGAR